MGLKVKHWAESSRNSWYSRTLPLNVAIESAHYERERNVCRKWTRLTMYGKKENLMQNLIKAEYSRSQLYKKCCHTFAWQHDESANGVKQQSSIFNIVINYCGHVSFRSMCFIVASRFISKIVNLFYYCLIHFKYL